ncbi:MAG: bifunctional DNA-formamidopyrimidine glycosylase/DNA-(apurinic or apyrimidinic site) lyase [Gemmatimonadota bacterium]|nr:bifunctional DNA-formamidopyrimidine glycosylase/DNA-(apurinic or apyrimidinic site) lyase [Gemmatimonadota bacterium]
MPELPEVETTVRHLRDRLVGRSVVRAEVARSNVVRGSVRRFVDAVEGSTVVGVERRGKFIRIDLDDDRVWVCHLRMSGKFRFVPSSAGRGERYVRAVFHLDDGGRLLYVDPRTLGEMEVVDPEAWASRASSLGPEPLDPDFTPALLRERLERTRRPVKRALLDQSVVAGLGNIYVSEALWRARISPRRRGANLGARRAERLRDAIVSVLQEALEGGGTSLGATWLNFADAEGTRGRFSEFLDVYGREGEACPRCGEDIRRIVQGQRATWYCPTCQR